MVMNSGVFQSTRQNYHHQIVFAKIHLNIFHPSSETHIELWKI